jgi:hypothetical protein
MKLLIMKFSPSPVTSSLLGPNILHITLLSNTLSLHSSLNFGEHVSHPYKTKGKIIVEVTVTGICLFLLLGTLITYVNEISSLTEMTY